MGMQNSVLKSRFGKFYKLELPRDINAQLSLKTESFWNESSTQQFINNLTVPNGYWHEIVNEHSTQSNTLSLSTDEIEQKVNALMMQGQLKVYPVEVPDVADHPPENRVIKSSDDIIYRFMPTSALLMLKNATVKQFQSTDEAKSFIAGLNTNDKKLTTIASELKIETPNTASVNKSETINAISSAIAAGSIVILEDKISSPPPAATEYIDTNDTIGNKKADLGPEKEETPLHWFAMKLVNEIDETYKNESFTINLSDESEEIVNDGYTDYRKENIPSGECKIIFTSFYDKIEQWIIERSQ